MGRSKRTSSESDRDVKQGANDKQRNSRVSKEEDISLDTWQEEVLSYRGNIALRAGRQVGKSTIVSRLAAERSIETPRLQIMIVSATERQAFLLFSKVLLYLDSNYRSLIKKGKQRPTKSQIQLKNGSTIRCLPCGLDGLGIRGFTTDLLIVDEAAFVPISVFPAIIPQLATTGGKIILLSTPFGAEGYFYDCFNDDSFKTWHINAEEIAESRPEPQRTFMKDHQEKQKERMTTLQYAQEYMGEFVSDFRRIFSDELISKCCNIKRQMIVPQAEYFLGVDISRMGDDKTALEVIRRIDKDNLIHVEHIFKMKQYTTTTFDDIVRLNKQYDFKKIGIDAGSGSLGVGILDFLLREPSVKRKVIALNNLSRQLDHLGERKRALLKEDMYFNLLALMEKSKIALLDDDEVIASLRAIQYEYNLTIGKKSAVRIFANEHKYTDLVEGLIRAAWLANAKHINTFISYI